VGLAKRHLSEDMALPRNLAGSLGSSPLGWRSQLLLTGTQHSRHMEASMQATLGLPISTKVLKAVLLFIRR